MLSRKIINAPVEYKASLFHFVGDIKLSHSLFALPFAFSSLFLIKDLSVTSLDIALLILCLVAARTFSMGINRILDRDIDRENPRTQARALASGQAALEPYVVYCSVAAAVLIVASYTLNPLCAYLSPLLLFVLGGYSMCKRWTRFSHFYLGLCLGLSPIAVELAMTSLISIPVITLCLAIAFWTAGFDILYSLQDQEFDRMKGLYSLPRFLGQKKSLFVSAICFLIFWLLLFHLRGFFGPFYLVGIAGNAIFLLTQLVEVRMALQRGEITKISQIFLSKNAGISVAFFFICFIDRWLRTLGIL